VGVKVWPVIIFPFFLRPFFGNFKKIISLVSVFAITVTVMFIPIYVTGFDKLSGFTAYSHYWQMNDALYMTLMWVSEFVLKILTGEPTHAQIVTRIVVMIILAAGVAYLNRNEAVTPDILIERILIIIAALFILSPTQFPWYYVWILPFLALSPRYSLLFLTPLLSLYYVRFYYSARDQASLFDHYIVWIEYIPPWCLLLVEWYRHRQGRSITLSELEA
jgi:alpha-1,6-mannosyltransferase